LEIFQQLFFLTLDRERVLNLQLYKIIMPKISKRTHRLVLRNLSKTKIKLKICKRIAQKLKKVIYKNKSTYKLKLVELVQKNVNLHNMLTKQQEFIHKLNRTKKNVDIQKTQRDVLDCAKTMIALNEQVCSKCLGTGTVLKTKKNIRYSIVCKECQTNNI
jgi:hypothetical protein